MFLWINLSRHETAFFYCAAMSHVLTEADLKAALPDLSSTQEFSTLRMGATIRRDRWGIPHIRATDEHDLFFAQGFATAQDRLFQMDFDRLRSLGRSSEYLGSSALLQDRYMRRRRIERVSKQDYALASRTSRNAIDAYSAGVNAFMATTKALPVEYKLLGSRPERWEPWHCIAVYKVRNTAEGSFQGKFFLSRLAAEVGIERAAKLSPGCQPGSLLTLPPGERFRGPLLNAVHELRAIVDNSSMLKDVDGGSNAWVVSGDLTESSLPLVAGDSHRGLEAPNVYYQVHLIGGDFSVAGYSIPGVPMVLHFAHNEHVAWGMTHGGIDTQDLYVERFREFGGCLEYLHRDHWTRAGVTRETITVRDGEAQQVEIVETHHGVVIAGDPRSGAAIAIADPGSKEGTPWIDAAYRVMRATSADDFEAALEGWTDRVNNYVYVDVYGDYGHLLRGKVPVRGSANGWGPVAGWSGEHEWHGYIPAAELPRVRNPQVGYVVSCNQRVIDATYPYYLSHFCSAAYRAERITERISELAQRNVESGRRIAISDMCDMHADATSIPARKMQKGLACIAGLRGKAAAAAETLLAWDCVLAVNSSDAALYETTAAKLTEVLIEAHYGPLAKDLLNASDAGAEEHWRRQLRAALFAALEHGDQSFAPPAESWESILSQSLEAAVCELEAQFGADPTKWRWGDLHRGQPQHALAAVFPRAAELLNPPRVEMAGDGDTPLVSGWKANAAFDVSLGSVNRYVHDPSNWADSRWIVPLGASGHPGSTHYADQQSTWANVATIPQLWDWDEIGHEAETEQVLKVSACHQNLWTGEQ